MSKRLFCDRCGAEIPAEARMRSEALVFEDAPDDGTPPDEYDLCPACGDGWARWMAGKRTMADEVAAVIAENVELRALLSDIVCNCVGGGKCASCGHYADEECGLQVVERCMGALGGRS